MKSKPDLPRRRAMRLQGYDYSQSGAYFVTICVQHRKCIFGTIIDGQIHLNEIGDIVVKWWNRIPQHFPSIEIGEYVIMPNHIHGIIAWNVDVGARSPRPKDKPSLGKIVAYFKYQSTKFINQHHNTPGKRIWQRNYHDHVIRDDNDLQRLREYIQNNPKKWELDQLHPDN
ncbi:MAG: transposase, partial [Candidatus Poribacteria bacterium]|nr:transposase [Candidatus Poribacteria bacterium]